MNKSNCSNKPLVVISNATRLHAHHHAFALQQAGMLMFFLTSIWYKPNSFPFNQLSLLPSTVKGKLKSFLGKRSHPLLEEKYTRQQVTPEVVRLALDVVTVKKYTEEMLYIHKTFYDWRIARQLSKLKPDIFVGYEISCQYSFAEAKRLGMVTILDLAGLHYEFVADQKKHLLGTKVDNWVTKKLNKRKQAELNNTDYIFCISSLAKSKLIENGIEKDKINVIPLGADLSIFKPKVTYNSTGTFRLLYVGNVSKQKGVDVLLQALKELDRSDVELVIIGSVVDLNILTPYAGYYQLTSYLSHDELVEYYQQADIFILPSLLDSWGMVVNEAMACATPVVVTENVGSKELVTADCGWVVPPGSASALKVVITDALSNREKLETMGRNACRAVENHTWDSYYKSIQSHIDIIWKKHSIPSIND